MDKDEIRKLANSGDAEAMYQLGLMYESGDGMMQNTSIALKRFREAADKGHEKAMEKLEQLSHKYKIASYTPTDSKEKKAPLVKALNDPLPPVLSEPSPPVLNDPPRSRFKHFMAHGLLGAFKWYYRWLIYLVIYVVLLISGVITLDTIIGPEGIGPFMAFTFLEILGYFNANRHQDND